VATRSEGEKRTWITLTHSVHANINAPLTTQAYHHFDDTHAAFDNHIAIGHMNDNNQNPMGQPYDASNPGTSSDSRAFASDGNVTIKSYADSGEAFMNGCNAAFSKMFNEGERVTRASASFAD
jgi:hypothetical protein